MIGAQTDQAVQEHLIEKYMLLPNQVWDSIIQQATKVREQYNSSLCTNLYVHHFYAGLPLECGHSKRLRDCKTAGQHPENQCQSL